MSPLRKSSLVACTSDGVPQRWIRRLSGSRCSRPTYRATPASLGLSTRSLTQIAMSPKRTRRAPAVSKVGPSSCAALLGGALAIGHLALDKTIQFSHQSIHLAPEPQAGLLPLVPRLA